MRDTVYFRQGVRLIWPWAWLYAFDVFLKGHTEPGGGFIAGLLWSGATILKWWSLEPQDRRLELFPYKLYLGIGLILAWLAVVGPALWGYGWMQSLWHFHAQVPLLGELSWGVPSYFDLGVMFVVHAVTTTLFLLVEESMVQSRKKSLRPGDNHE